MPLQIQGNAGVTAEVETATRAMRTVLRPTDYGALGAYAIALQTGTMAAGLAAASEIFQFRYTGANVAIIRQITFGGGGIVAFAAGMVLIDLIIARNWTVDGSGGTAATITGNNGKLRTSMATTGVGAIRIASTAALTAGTKTLDNQAAYNIGGGIPAVAGNAVLPETYLFNPDTESEYPIVLAQNEGFSIRATVPATGTWTAGIGVKWMELSSYAP